jgi:putative ABC transport system permease protein
MLHEFFSRLRFALRWKRRVEVDEELQFHIDRQVESNMAAGMSAEEARRKAGIAFGSRELALERCHEVRPSWTVELVLHDLKLGMRGLFRNPGLTSVAVLTLALAIGANSTIFSLLSQALLRALPVRDPAQLVVLSFAGPASGHIHSDGGNTPGHRHEFSYPMYRDLRDRNDVLSGLIAAASTPIGVTWNNRAEAVSAEMVSGNYFDVLGVQPALGRLFGASDETAPGANPVAVLSFDYWKTHLAEAPVAGKTLLVNGSPFTIVGVAAPGFRSMVWGRVPDVYVPLTMQRTVEPAWDYLPDRHSYWLNMIGRVRPGISPAKAEAAFNPLFKALRTGEFANAHDQSPKARNEFIANSQLNLEGGARGFSPLRQDVRTPIVIIMCMVLLVTAMAVVNVASLLLVRAQPTACGSSRCATRSAPPAARFFASCCVKGCYSAWPEPPSACYWPLRLCVCSSPGWPRDQAMLPHLQPRSIGAYSRSHCWPHSPEVCSSASPLHFSSGIRDSPKLSSSRLGRAWADRCDSGGLAWPCRSDSACS